MMSYMKEEGNQANGSVDSKKNENTGSLNTGNSSASNSSSSRSFVTESAGDDFLVPSASEKKVKYSTFILMAVFIAGIAALFIMVKNSTFSKAEAGLSEQDLKIESAIARLKSSRAQFNTKMTDVVNKISDISVVEQVEVHQLKKNPFKRGAFFSSANVNEFDIRADLKKTAEGFQLWTIMESDQKKSCMINDKILNLNDEIDGFAVKQIGEGFVVLVSGRKKIVLRITE